VKRGKVDRFMTKEVFSFKKKAKVRAAWFHQAVLNLLNKQKGDAYAIPFWI
jgi:hypothetical protein